MSTIVFPPLSLLQKLQKGVHTYGTGRRTRRNSADVRYQTWKFTVKVIIMEHWSGFVNWKGAGRARKRASSLYARSASSLYFISFFLLHFIFQASEWRAAGITGKIYIYFLNVEINPALSKNLGHRKSHRKEKQENKQRQLEIHQNKLRDVGMLPPPLPIPVRRPPQPEALGPSAVPEPAFLATYMLTKCNSSVLLPGMRYRG